MKSTLRTLATATALLVPLAGALVAQPAAAEQRHVVVTKRVVQTVGIQRFAVVSPGRLLPGREVRFRVVGTPRAHASVDIPGVTRNVYLRETRPGVYEGSYTVRRHDNPRAFDRAVASLRDHGQRVTARAEIPGRDFGYGYGR